MLIGVRDADGGDRKKNNKGSDLSGTTGTVDDEEEEEFAPDYSEECERLQLEVKSLRENAKRTNETFIWSRAEFKRASKRVQRTLEESGEGFRSDEEFERAIDASFGN